MDKEKEILRLVTLPTVKQCLKCKGHPGWTFIAHHDVYLKANQLVVEIFWFCGSCAEGWKQTIVIGLGDVISDSIDLDGYHEQSEH